jgi:hypothetical protein
VGFRRKEENRQRKSGEGSSRAWRKGKWPRSGDSPTGDGIGVDPNYKGKGLQVEVIVDDTGVFTGPWMALVTYRRASDDWVERICAENTREFGVERNPPRADKSDF